MQWTAEQKGRIEKYTLQVIRKHIESTILHEISHVLPTSDEFAKEEEEEDDESKGNKTNKNKEKTHKNILNIRR